MTNKNINVIINYDWDFAPNFRAYSKGVRKLEIPVRSLKGLRPIYSITLFNILLAKGFQPIFANANLKEKKKWGWVVFFEDTPELRKVLDEYSNS